MIIKGRNIILTDTPQPTGLRGKARFTGYWYDTQKHSTPGLGTGNIGSYFEFSISNTNKIDILTDSWNGNPGFLAYLSYSINGSSFQRTAIHPNFDGINIYPIITGLNPSLTYTIKIMVSNLFTNASQLWAGTEVFIINDILGSAGAIIGKIPDNRDTLLVQGDSITAGYNNAIPDQSKGEWSYAHLLEALTGMRVIAHGFGSTGLTVAGEGGVPRFGINMFNLNASIPLTNQFIPKKILIEGGTNDASADNTVFINNYKQLISDAKAKWPLTKIYILPPLNNTKRSQILSIIADDNTLTYINPDSWVNQVTLADSLHWDKNGHEVAATNIATSINA